MRRLMIWIPVYALLVVVLPRHDGFEHWTEPLLRLHPDTVLKIDVAVLVVSVALILLLRREPQPDFIFRRPIMGAILFAGLIGAAFSAIMDVFDYFSGGVPNLIYLFLVPIAFMIAEGVSLAIEWRFANGPMTVGGAPRGFEAHPMDEELGLASLGKGTSFLSEARAEELLNYAAREGVLIRSLEVWRVDGDSAQLRPDLSVQKSDVRRLSPELTMDLINARLKKAMSEPAQHVYVLSA